MTLYSFRALDAAGKTSKGTIQASSTKDAYTLLKERKVYPVSVKQTQPFSLHLPGLNRRRGLPIQRLAAFTRQLATLLDATIPYDAALGMIQQETTDVAFKTVLANVRSRVMEGTYLADAMAAHPEYFPTMMHNMVRAGESSGTLVLVMQRMADYYDSINRLRTKLVSALVYPGFMAVFGLSVVIFMVTYIIPRIARLFGNFGATLPLPTRILIGASDLVTNWWWLLLGIVLLIVMGLRRFVATDAGQRFLDRLELELPAWKLLRRKMILQRFTQTLGTLLKSGVDLKEALSIAADVMENSIYREATRRVIFEIQNKGIPLAVALRREGLFPEDVCQMVAIGEETATLDTMMDHLAVRQAQEVNATMEAATALFEPVMILVMGAAVGFIAISILLPLLQMNTLIG